MPRERIGDALLFPAQRNVGNGRRSRRLVNRILTRTLPLEEGCNQARQPAGADRCRGRYRVGLNRTPLGHDTPHHSSSCLRSAVHVRRRRPHVARDTSTTSLVKCGCPIYRSAPVPAWPLWRTWGTTTALVRARRAGGQHDGVRPQSSPDAESTAMGTPGLLKGRSSTGGLLPASPLEGGNQGNTCRGQCFPVFPVVFPASKQGVFPTGSRGVSRSPFH